MVLLSCMPLNQIRGRRSAGARWHGAVGAHDEAPARCFPAASRVSRDGAALVRELQSDINTEGCIKWEVWR